MKTFLKKNWRWLCALYVFIYLPWFFYLERTITMSHPDMHIMNGVIDDGYFIASFWHDGPQKSNGCVYTKLTGDNRYDGYYLEEHDGIIDRTPITLVKNKFNQSS